MGIALEWQGNPMHGIAGDEQGRVERLAIERDQRLAGREKFDQPFQQGGFLGGIAHEELLQEKSVFDKSPNPDEEGICPCAAGHPGRFRIEEGVFFDGQVGDARVCSPL